MYPVPSISPANINKGALVQIITYHRGETLKGVHGRLRLRVEVRGLARTSDDVGIALEGHHVDLAVNLPLAELEGVLEKLPLRTEVHA